MWSPYTNSKKEFDKKIKEKYNNKIIGCATCQYGIVEFDKKYGITCNNDFNACLNDGIGTEKTIKEIDGKIWKSECHGNLRWKYKKKLFVKNLEDSLFNI